MREAVKIKSFPNFSSNKCCQPGSYGYIFCADEILS
jgi:hypothetical protein